MFDLRQFLTFPFRDPQWIKKIIIGCVITIVPVLNILTLGYYIECINLGISGRQILPEWDNWGEHFREGIMALLIAAAYLLIPVIIAFIPGAGPFLAPITFLIVGIMIPMALADYAVTRDLRDAFNISGILQQIAQVAGYYLISYLIIILLYAVATALIIFLPYLAFIGVLLSFYSGVIFFNLVGRLYHTARYE